MKTRYTAKSLESDVEKLNATLAKLGHEYRFVVGGRNGYTAIDLATPKQMEKHGCQSMLIGGTPRECLNECNQYLANVITRNA